MNKRKNIIAWIRELSAAIYLDVRLLFLNMNRDVMLLKVTTSVRNIAILTGTIIDRYFFPVYASVVVPYELVRIPTQIVIKTIPK